jgi:GNAT superfamily N-acetyltransferase
MTQRALEIRPARAADREAFWPLLGALAITFEPERAAFDAAFAALLAEPDTLVLVARVPELGVVGYLVAYRQITLLANGPAVWVGELIVDDRVRRGGVGRALMARAEDWSREQGAAQVALATSRADDFYRALGYTDAAVYFRKKLS